MSDLKSVRRRPTRSSGGPAVFNSGGMDSGSGSPARKAPPASRLDSVFTLLLTAFMAAAGALLVSFFLFPAAFPEAALQKALTAVGLQQRVHAVVIDAGSTGSRVLAFSFSRGFLNGQLQLEDELWLQVKPGLSSYSEAPTEAANSIRGLLKEAKAKIPQASWASTPVTLKATAGLRLLPKDKSEAILAEVEKELRTSGFAPESPLIEIMNPMEEGLFAWFTVNILLDQFTSPDLSGSHASLDLGGGSTQIVMAPSKPVSGLEGRKHFLHNVTVLQRPTQVYSHSYLGMGLMAARKAVFQLDNEEGKTALRSPCVKSKHPLTWDYQGVSYGISATDTPSLHHCLEAVARVVDAENVHVPTELASRDIAAFSYFYDKAVERDLMPRETEGTVRVGDYLAAAKKICDPEGVNDSGFYCVDLSFIYALLSRGYGLPDSKEINLYKKIKGHEASWALGLAYNILERA